MSSSIGNSSTNRRRVGMDPQTISRALQIFVDQPGTTRSELATALSIPCKKCSDSLAGRIIAHLRDHQHKFKKSGYGYVVVAEDSVNIRSTPGSKGLSIDRKSVVWGK